MTALATEALQEAVRHLPYFGAERVLVPNSARGRAEWYTMAQLAALIAAIADPFAQYALLAGRSGGQTLNGSSASAQDLNLSSTAHATKRFIYLGPLTGGQYLRVNHAALQDVFGVGAGDQVEGSLGQSLQMGAGRAATTQYADASQLYSTPNASSGGIHGKFLDMYVQPTANNTGFVGNGNTNAIAHDSGAFNLGTLRALAGETKKSVGGTLDEMRAVQGTVRSSAGTVTAGYGFVDGQVIETGGAMTTYIAYIARGQLGAVAPGTSIAFYALSTAGGSRFVPGLVAGADRAPLEMVDVEGNIRSTGFLNQVQMSTPATPASTHGRHYLASNGGAASPFYVNALGINRGPIESNSRYRGTNFTKTNNTLGDVIAIDLGASETLYFDFWVMFDADAADDMKVAMIGPAGCTGYFSVDGVDGAGANVVHVPITFTGTVSTARVVPGNGAFAFGAINVRGSVVGGGTAGEVKLQAANNGAGGGTMNIYTQSRFYYEKMAADA